MNLLMLSGDRSLASGEQGPFHWMLEEYRRHWDRIDIVTPAISTKAVEAPFENVQLHPRQGGRLVHTGYCRWVFSNLPSPPDLIVSHDYGLFLNGIAAARLHRESQRPWISEIHHVDGYPRAANTRARVSHLLTRLFVRSISGSVTAFRVPSRQVGDALESWGIDEHKIEQLGSIYLDARVHHPHRRRRDDTSPDFDVLFCGRLEPEKGVRLFLEALRQVRPSRPNLNVRVVGRGSQEKRVDAALRALDLEHADRLPWVESADDLADLYRRSKILVCTSFAEGNPRVVAEAMACGTPVISTPVGRAVELIQDGVNGRLVGWQAAEVASAISDLLGQDDQREAMAAAAPEAVAELERDRVVAAMATRYRELAAT